MRRIITIWMATGYEHVLTKAGGYVLALVFMVGLFSCGSKHEEAGSGQEQVFMTSRITLNLRKGPGTRYGVVGKIRPKEAVQVIGDTDSSWIMVRKATGIEGYASAKYLAVTAAPSAEAKGKAPKSEGRVPKANGRATESKGKAQASRTVGGGDKSVLVSASSVARSLPPASDMCGGYVRYMLANSTNAYMILAVLFAIELLLYLWLRAKYNYIDSCDSQSGVAVGYIVVVIFAALTICQMVGIAEVRKRPSYDDILYAFMLLSTGLLMAVLPWRIKISGLDDISDHDDNGRVWWGDTIGFFTWAILLLPLCNYYLDACEYIPLDFPDETLGGMLWTMAKFLFFTGLFCGFVWPYLIVRYCLKSMGSIVLWALNIVIIYGVGKYGYYMCDESFSGLLYLVSLFCGFMIVCWDCGLLFSPINERRCGNCHTFDGQYTGKTDLGYSYSTSTSWENDNDDYALRHRSYDQAYVSNTRRQVRTTYRTDRWKTHYCCPYCDNRWELDHKDKYAVDHQTMRHEWTETRFR